MFNTTFRFFSQLYYFLIIGWLQNKCIYEIPYPHSSLFTGFVTRATRQVPLVEQGLLTLQDHMSSPNFSWVRVARSLVFCVVFCRSLLVLFLLAIVLSVRRFTDSDYPFGIFKLLIVKYKGDLSMATAEPNFMKCNRNIL